VTIYPEEQNNKFALSLQEPKEFALKFRAPTWADGTNKVLINGDEVQAECKPGEWMTFTRIWNNEDTITIAYEFELKFTPVDECSKDVVALSYDPIVLRAEDMVLLIGNADHPENWIHKVEGEHYVFETDKGHIGGYDFVTKRFKPYYKVPAMEWYFMYNRIKTE